MSFPKNLSYSKDFIWIEEKEGVIILGLIDIASEKAKEFVYINFPKKGENIKKNNTLISLEAVKWTGKLKSPVSGKVIEINSKAYDEPSIVNSKPYEVWLVKIKMDDNSELKELMNNEQAITFYKKEFE
jgi:glycine cleavage system H protein